MELMEKQGFKQTEVGLIPEDWCIEKIGNITNSFSGGTPNTSIREYYQGNIPWISSSELNQGLIYYTKNYISQKGLESSSAKIVIKNTFLLAMYGATAGVSAITKIEGAINQAVLAIESKNIIPYYLYSFFQLKKDYIINTYTQGGQPNLSGNIVKSIYIPLPPTLAEQKAIATALSDVDELITNLDQLITKKKALKQGAMQQLLTPPHKGGKRLEGFSGNWEEKTVGEIAEYKNGTAHENCVVENGDFIIVNSKFVSTEGKVVKYSNKNLSPVNKAEILMVLSDIPNGKAIAKCYFVEEDNKYTLNQRICSFKTEKVDARFLFLLLNRNPYYLQFDDGVKQTNLRNQDVLSCPICIPPSKKEQEQISTIIFDLQKDIELAIRKKEKYQSVKQGMMQELLTGKTRLI